MSEPTVEVFEFEGQGLTEAFWDTLVRDYWGRRPVVFKKVLAAPVISEQGLFDVFVTASARHLASRERHRPGKKRARLSFYGDGSNAQVLEDHAAWLPTERDGSFGAYAARLERELGSRQWGAFLNTLHPYAHDLWRASREMVFALFQRVGAAMGRVGVESFIGPYDSTPFGVHKDQAHILTFPVMGEKRTRLWPYAGIATHLGLGHSDSDLETVRNTPFRKHVPDDEPPIRLIAGVGDVTYWPPSYWHIVDGQGDLNAAVTLGIEPNDDPMALAAKILARQPPFTERTTPVADGSPRTSARRLAHWKAMAQAYADALRSRDLEGQVQDELDRQDSNLMFDGAIERRDDVVIGPGDVLLSDARFPILVREKEGGRACYINGNRLMLAASPGLDRLVARLNGGGEHAVDELIELTVRASDGGLEARDVLAVLTTFAAFHALALRPR